MWRFITIIFRYLNHCLHLKTSYNDCDDGLRSDRIYFEKHHQVVEPYEKVFYHNGQVSVLWALGHENSMSGLFL